MTSVSEIPELTQANLIECLRYSAFKLCGKGPQEDYASDAMSMAVKEIERLRYSLREMTPDYKMLVIQARDDGAIPSWVEEAQMIVSKAYKALGESNDL